MHILTGMVAMAAQSFALRNAALRRRLGIAPLPKKDKNWSAPGLRESVAYVGEWWAEKQQEAQTKAMRGPPRKW